MCDQGYSNLAPVSQIAPQAIRHCGKNPSIRPTIPNQSKRRNRRRGLGVNYFSLPDHARATAQVAQSAQFANQCFAKNSATTRDLFISRSDTGSLAAPATALTATSVFTAPSWP